MVDISSEILHTLGTMNGVAQAKTYIREQFGVSPKLENLLRNAPTQKRLVSMMWDLRLSGEGLGTIKNKQDRAPGWWHYKDAIKRSNKAFMKLYEDMLPAHNTMMEGVNAVCAKYARSSWDIYSNLRENNGDPFETIKVDAFDWKHKNSVMREVKQLQPKRVEFRKTPAGHLVVRVYLHATKPTKLVDTE